MKTSCIQHGEGERFLMIREDFMDLVDRNACAAALLSVFEHWTNSRLENREQAEAINERDRRAKQPETQDTGLWIFRTRTELIEKDLCGVFGRTVFDKAIELVVTLKLVERRHNPRNKRDRTLQYRLDVTRVNGLLEQRRKSANGKAEIDTSKSGNQQLLDGEENQQQNQVPPVRPPKQKIGGKEVTAKEISLAEEIIVAFNQEAGTSYKPDSIDHLRPVVSRVREFPDLSADQHRGIIAAVFAGRRWWTGQPAPAIIYGSRGQFERSIEDWRAAGGEPLGKARLRLVEAVDLDRVKAGREEFEAIWHEARANIEANVPESTFRLWLQPIELYGADGDCVFLSAPDGIRAWTERRYSSLIEEALTDVAGRPVTSTFAAPSPEESEEAA